MNICSWYKKIGALVFAILSFTLIHQPAFAANKKAAKAAMRRDIRLKKQLNKKPGPLVQALEKFKQSKAHEDLVDLLQKMIRRMNTPKRFKFRKPAGRKKARKAAMAAQNETAQEAESLTSEEQVEEEQIIEEIADTGDAEMSDEELQQKYKEDAALYEDL